MVKNNKWNQDHKSETSSKKINGNLNCFVMIANVFGKMYRGKTRKTVITRKFSKES